MSFTEVWHRLTPLYEKSEAKAIALWLLEAKMGLGRTAVYAGALEDLPPAAKSQLEALLHRLEQAEPIQYVLGTADFGGRSYIVAPGVLIPRPETELLCQMVADEKDKLPQPTPQILDIGTGSGCIACTLAANMPEAAVTAWDISPDALHIARQNAERAHVQVSFWLQDALNPPPGGLQWAAIVSNPPYVCESERHTMARNVLDHEPGLALFVPDKDALRFYRAIGQYAVRTLLPGGRLYLEINERFGNQTLELLQGFGFSEISIHHDQFGKERFIKACR